VKNSDIFSENLEKTAQGEDKTFGPGEINIRVSRQNIARLCLNCHKICVQGNRKAKFNLDEIKAFFK
jgi:hypothetical protein